MLVYLTETYNTEPVAKPVDFFDDIGLVDNRYDWLLPLKKGEFRDALEGISLYCEKCIAESDEGDYPWCGPMPSTEEDLEIYYEAEEQIKDEITYQPLEERFSLGVLMKAYHWDDEDKMVQFEIEGKDIWGYYLNKYKTSRNNVWLHKNYLCIEKIGKENGGGFNILKITISNLDENRNSKVSIVNDFSNFFDEKLLEVKQIAHIPENNFLRAIYEMALAYKQMWYKGCRGIKELGATWKRIIEHQDKQKKAS